MEADFDMEWPEENQQRSAYYIPNRIETAEQPAPPPQPKLLKKTAAAAEAPSAAVQSRVTLITDMAWTDEGTYLKVYIPVPGVREDKVSVQFEADKVDLRADGTPTGTHKLELRRMYGILDPGNCQCRVQPDKNRITLILAKPPRASQFDEVKYWPRLHLHGSSADVPITEWQGGRMTKAQEQLPQAPKIPDVSRRS